MIGFKKEREEIKENIANFDEIPLDFVTPHDILPPRYSLQVTVALNDELSDATLGNFQQQYL